LTAAERGRVFVTVPAGRFDWAIDAFHVRDIARDLPSDEPKPPDLTVALGLASALAVTSQCVLTIATDHGLVRVSCRTPLQVRNVSAEGLLDVPRGVLRGRVAEALEGIVWEEERAPLLVLDVRRLEQGSHGN
jgi:hypothetical protein